MHPPQHETYAKFRFRFDTVAAEVYVQEVIQFSLRGSCCGLREVPRIREYLGAPLMNPLQHESYAKFRFRIDTVAAEVYVQEVIQFSLKGSCCGL